MKTSMICMARAHRKGKLASPPKKFSTHTPLDGMLWEGGGGAVAPLLNITARRGDKVKEMGTHHDLVYGVAQRSAETGIRGSGLNYKLYSIAYVNSRLEACKQHLLKIKNAL